MKNAIKIWPYIDDLSQAIVPYQNTNLNKDSTIFIDFSNVRSVNSSGVAITLVKLLPIIEKFNNSIWNMEKPVDVNINSFFERTGVYEIINEKINNKGLFSNPTIQNESSNFVTSNLHDIKITSFPLIRLDYEKFERRICVEDFIDKLIIILSPYIGHYNIKINILLKLIKEIAKNSEDHTSSSAIFGIDLVENSITKKGKIQFSFCDFGIGIHGNIKKHIENDKRYREYASTKMGLVDSYHYAYTPGFTTSKSKHNKGIGMSMILDCVNILDLQLTIYDAKSMGFIPKVNTHEEIRRNFWNTGNSVGFYYYGNFDLNK